MAATLSTILPRLCGAHSSISWATRASSSGSTVPSRPVHLIAGLEPRDSRFDRETRVAFTGLLSNACAWVDADFRLSRPPSQAMLGSLC